MDLRIGVATPDDVGEMLTVQRAGYITEALLYGTPDLPPILETAEEVSAAVRAQADGSSAVLAAWLGTRLVGAVRGRVARDAARPTTTCHIGRLVVAPDLHGNGIGGRLLTAIEEHLAHADRFELFTGDRSVTNLAFYRRRGYREFARRPDGPHVTLVYLDKPAPR